MSRTFSSLLFAVAIAGITGCADEESFYYEPHPAVAALPATQPSAASPVTVFATVLGVRHPDHSPYLIDTRLMLESNSASTILFDPQSLELTNGELVRFPPPNVSANAPFPVEPGQRVTIDATFRLPPGATADTINIDSLQLRWLVQIDGQRIGQAVNFHRVDEDDEYYRPYYGDPYYEYPYPYGGVVIVHRGWR
jgi:hypothetical protein